MSIKLLEEATARKFTAAEVLHTRVIRLQRSDGQMVVRLVAGPLSGVINVDYLNPDLSSLKEDVQWALNNILRLVRKESPDLRPEIYDGSNHLDIINPGVGSLDWLLVSDNFVS